MNFETIRQADTALAEMMREFEHYQGMSPSYIQRALGFLHALAQGDERKSKKYREVMNPERDLPILRLVGLLDDKDEIPSRLKPAIAVMVVMEHDHSRYRVRPISELLDTGELVFMESSTSTQGPALVSTSPFANTGEERMTERTPSSIPLKGGVKIPADIIEATDGALQRIVVELSSDDPDGFQRTLHWLKDASNGHHSPVSSLPPHVVSLLEEKGLLQDGRLSYAAGDAMRAAIVEDAEAGVHRLKVQSLYNMVAVPAYKAPEQTTGDPTTTVKPSDIWARLGMKPPPGKDEPPGGGIGY